MRKQLAISYDDFVSIENLLAAWSEFIKGKRKKSDVQLFGLHLMDNICALHEELRTFRYVHGAYQPFKINDPKPRDIHKASVRDRLVHHAVYRQLYPFFDATFIHDSFSCRRLKGTHRAGARFAELLTRVGNGDTRTVWVLKCDIKKFFASIDHRVLFKILRRYTSNEKVLWLLYAIVGSFDSGIPNVGLPLGNLTSQLFVNIYMNEFDQFVKHELRAKYYIRYADDFVFMSHNCRRLEEWLPRIEYFLGERLKLSLHPDKVSIKTLASGVDFLGWVHFPYHRVLRTGTKRRMMRNIDDHNLQSYLGMLRHGDAHGLSNTMAEVVLQEVGKTS